MSERASEADHEYYQKVAESQGKRLKSARDLLLEFDLPTLIETGRIPIMQPQPGRQTMIVVRDSFSELASVHPVQRFMFRAWGFRAESHEAIHTAFRGTVNSQEPCDAAAGGACWTEFRNLEGPVDSHLLKDLGDAAYLMTRSRNSVSCAAGMFIRVGQKHVVGRVTVPCSMVYIAPDEFQEIGLRDLHPKERRAISKAFADPISGEEFLANVLVDASAVVSDFMEVDDGVPRHNGLHYAMTANHGPLLVFTWSYSKRGDSNELLER